MAKGDFIELVDAQEKRYQRRLGTLINQGGAGSIYQIEGDSQTVVKIYHNAILKKECPKYQKRIDAMLNSCPDLPDIHLSGQRYVQLAWPNARALRGNAFIGFSMPAMDLNRTEGLDWIINEDLARRRGFRTDLGARVTLARQLAGVLADLHAQGHHIVDLKPQNINFYRKELYMAILDCDGFNIYNAHTHTYFIAPHYTPDYLAPEFQVVGTNPNDSPEAQDRFALAVVTFQLLNHGLHPYAGSPKVESVPNEMEGRIAQGLYAYGLVSHPEIAPLVMSAHTCLTAELRGFFDRAFGNDPRARPSAKQWRDCLNPYANADSRKIIQCGINPSHYHFAGQSCGPCQRDAIRGPAQAHKTFPSQRQSRQQPPQTTAASTLTAAAARTPTHWSAPGGKFSRSQIIWIAITCMASIYYFYKPAEPLLPVGHKTIVLDTKSSAHTRVPPVIKRPEQLDSLKDDIVRQSVPQVAPATSGPVEESPSRLIDDPARTKTYEDEKIIGLLGDARKLVAQGYYKEAGETMKTCKMLNSENQECQQIEQQASQLYDESFNCVSAGRKWTIKERSCY
jgi:hypothetical protein